MTVSTPKLEAAKQKIIKNNKENEMTMKSSQYNAYAEKKITIEHTGDGGDCQLCCLQYLSCDLSCENGEYYMITKNAFTSFTSEEKTCNCQRKCTTENPIKSPYTTQVGGNHYNKKHDLAELLIGNDAGFAEGNISKYVLRHKSKNGFEDVQKAFHYLQMIAYSVYGKSLVDEDA